MGYSKNFVVGITAQGEVKHFKWKSNSTILVCGGNGSGKTMSTAYWMSQLAYQGVRFLVIDPHGEDKQSLVAYTEHLRDAYIGEPVKDYAGIPDAVKWVHDLGQKRLEDPTLERWPLMLVIDEFTAFLLRRDDRMKATVDLLLDICNQMRKAECRLLLQGQTWGKSANVASSLRDAAGASIVFKSSDNDANKFTAQKNTRHLKPGQGIFEEEIIFLPMLTATDKLKARDKVATYNHTQDIYAPVINSTQPDSKLFRNNTELLLNTLLVQDEYE